MRAPNKRSDDTSKQPEERRQAATPSHDIGYDLRRIGRAAVAVGVLILLMFVGALVYWVIGNPG